MTRYCQFIKKGHCFDRFNSTYSNLISLPSVENLKLTWLYLFWHLNCLLINDVNFEHIRQFSSYASKQSHNVSLSILASYSASTAFPSILNDTAGS